MDEGREDGEEIGVLKINYTVESGEDGPRPVVHVFGRTQDGEARHVRVTDFQPYFYAPNEEVEKDVKEDERVTGTERGFESIDGDDLTRIYTRIPADVSEVRESYHHYEADILFPNRFRIDKDVRSGLRLGADEQETVEIDADEVVPCDADTPARTCVLDIEVDDRNGFPEDGEEPVICVAAWDSFDDEYQMFVWDIDEEEVDADGYVLHAYDTEEDMLDAFLTYLNERDADVLTGWNSNDFDLPYIIDRLERLEGEGMEPERLSRVGEVWHDDWGGPRIKGRATFDLLYAYQRMKFTELESYRLDAIAEEELGESKVTYTGKIGDLWEDDPDKLLEYNKMDVELCVRIDEKVGIIDFFRELARFVGCSLEDATTPSDVVDVYVLRKAHGKFVLPSKRGGGGGEEYEGGEVFEPITGIRENVAVLDLACFSGDTEVVTPNGVTNIQDVSVGDEVYTLNPETFEVEMDEVVETHEYENEYCELHHVSGNTHDFKVTENHRFLVSNKRGWDSQTPEDFDFVEYRDVTETDRFAFPNHEPMGGERRETFEFWREVDEGYATVYADRDLRSVRHDLPDEVCEEMELAHGSSGALKLKKTGKYLVPIDTYRRHREGVENAADDVVLKHGRQHRATPTTFETDDWLRLVGWYVSKGTLDGSSTELTNVTEGSVHDGGAGDHSVTLHQQGDERDEIRDLLERMELNYSVDTRGLNLSNRFLLDWFVENCGATSDEKHLPEYVFELDASHLRVLLKTLIKGDGTPSERTGNVDKFWTKSDRLKDDIVRLGVRCGHKPTVKKQSDGTWYVSFGKRGSFNKSVNASVEEHDGRVYCLTARNNHVVLAGRGGKFQWIGQSLYPMSMISVNASPETKVDEDYDGETFDVEMPDGTEVRFRKEPEGLTKSIVTELLEERDKKKAARDDHEMGSEEYVKYDNQQNAIKVVMNSYYGVAGYPRFRLYDREMGSAVTATGRKVIEHTKEVVEDEGYEVVYGDTDSTLAELGDGNLDTLVGRGESIEETVNESYDDFALEEFNAKEHRWEIEFEKLYRRFFQAGRKKRYAGRLVWKEGNEVDDLDITGFEYKRSDVAQVTKEVQKEVIRRILEGEGFDEISEYLQEVVEQFKDGEYGYDEVGVPGGIGQKLDSYDTDTAQVKGAKYANEHLGTNFTSGSKPKRLYVKRVKGDYPTTDVVCFEYPEQIPEEFEVDWEKMLEKTVQGPIERILEALDWSWSEVVTGQRQQGLGSFT
jgi:DNA polymerase I